MNYFLNNPQTQKLMSDEELMALALQNKERAQAQRKKKEMKSCGCCPVDPSGDAQRHGAEDGLRKDFDIRYNWHFFVSLFLSSSKRPKDKPLALVDLWSGVTSAWVELVALCIGNP